MPIFQTEQVDHSRRWEPGMRAYWDKERKLLVLDQTDCYVGEVIQPATITNASVYVALPEMTWTPGEEPWTRTLMSCHLDEELHSCLERWLQNQPIHVVREVIEDAFRRALTHLDQLESETAADISRYQRREPV